MNRKDPLKVNNLPADFMLNVISTEALSVHKPLQATVNKLSGFIRDISTSLKDTDILGSLDTILRRDKSSSAVEQKAIQKVQREAYSDLMSIKLPCIAGLSSTWLKLLRDLDPGVQFAVNFYDRTLNDTTKFLAEVITSPDKLDSIARRYNITSVDYKKLIDDIGVNLTGNSRVAELPYGKLLERNADLQDCVMLTRKFSDELYRSNQDLVTERIAQIKKQLEQIAKDITDPNTSYRMSGRNIDQLARISYNLAQAVEYYGIVLSIFTEHQRSFDQAIVKLAK